MAEKYTYTFRINFNFIAYDIHLNIPATNLGVRDDGLPDAADSQIIAAESVRAVVGRIVLDIEMLEFKSNLQRVETLQLPPGMRR